MAFITDNILSDLLIIATTVYAAIYTYFYFAYQYWEKRRCPYLPPKFPMGNSSNLLNKTSTFTLETTRYYEAFKERGLKFGGIYIMARPVFVVVDPEYIKDVLSKDFQYFIDRGFYHNEKYDPISAHLFALDDTKWKNMRTKLTPTFTSGKMKTMFQTMVDCSNFMVEAIEEHAKNKSDIDIREFLAKFTTDVIGSCAFGIDCNNFKDPNSMFRRMGDAVFQINGFRRMVQLILISKMPKIAQKLGVKALRDDVSEFFTNLVTNSVKYREENNYNRPDFLQLLMDLRTSTKDTSSPFTMQQLIAQVFLFFVAGFDTSSTTMNFAVYELCRNLDVQEKLRKEIEEVLANHDGKITYESLGEMTYLQQVIDESQRMFPPVVNLTRNCVKDYKLRDTDIVIEKGTQVVVPLYALHHDPEYYPDPERFDPDRFSADNKKSRHPFAHLPFGEGPRNCIGLRFGLMQSKIGLITILRKFRLKISHTTKLPLELDRRVFLLKSVKPLYIKAEKL